jgi:hypothetical protein
LAVTVVLFSPLLWYAHAGFGEALAAFAVAAAAAAVILRWPSVVIALAFTFAGATKETSIPFLLAIALIALYRTGRRPGRRELGAVAVGLCAALALNTGFNVFRYGSPVNLDYARAAYTMPPGSRGEYVAALIASPNLGLALFWPGALALIGVAVTAGLRGAHGLQALSRRPALWLAGVGVALLLVFASWYAPFGGIAWGPRLMLPWVPALVMLSISLHGEALERVCERLLRTPWRLCLTAALMAAFAVPQLVAAVDAAGYDHRTLTVSADEVWIAPHVPDAVCPEFYGVLTAPGSYYDCLHHTAWKTHPWALASAYRSLDEGPLRLFALLTVASIAGLLGLAALRLRGDLETRTWP